MSIVVLASAGTGKTWTLVDAWVRAALGLDVDSDAVMIPADRLCAITFTEKAAAEMRSRVEQRLTVVRFMPDQEPALRDDLIARHGAMPSTSILDGVRRAVGRAPIGTFHALCGRLLREHAIAANLDPGFRILEPDEEQRMLIEIAEGVVLDALAANDVNVADLVARLPLRGLFEQRGFVEGLVALWGSLAERGYDAGTLPTAQPSSSVAAAMELVRTVAIALDQAADAAGKGGVKGKGVAATAMASLSMLAQVTTLPPAERIDETVNTLAALTKNIGGNWGGVSLAEHRRGMVEAVARLCAAVVDDDVVGLGPTIRELLSEIDLRQRREKEQRAVLGFGDMLVRCRDLLRDNRSVRARVKSRITRLFVDEYQDTSPVQEQLTALLAEDPSRGDALVAHAPLAAMRIPTGRLFIVGDPKQSIYGFRGADAAVFTRAQQAIVDGKGTLQRLTVSRRSTSSVCAFVNLVSHSTLPGHADEDLVALDAEPVEVLPVVGAWWRAGPSLKALKLPSVEIESAVVADRVVAMLVANGHRPGDITILTRRGRSTAVFGRALARRGVPVRVIGGDGFWLRPEILDVVSALALVVDPRDELAAMTVLRSPLIGVADDQILAVFEAIPSDKGGFTWPRIVAASDDDLVERAVADRIRAFDALLVSIRSQLAMHPLSHAIDKVIDDGGYAVACAAELDGPQRLRHLEKLRALSAGRPEDGVLGISRLVDAIDDPPAEAIVFDAPVGEDAVRIMTVHQSKGLEAEIVIVADAGIGLRTESDDVAFDADVGLAVSSRGRTSHRAVPKPSSTPGLTTMMQRVRRARRTRDEAELTRLLYVALTRARQAIYVVGEARRRGPGSMLGLLEIARTADADAFDALLPVDELDAVDERLRFRATRTAAAAAPLTMPTATTTTTVPRVRASVLHARAIPQLSMGLMGEAFGEHEEDIIPPRARGRLAHAVIGLVATELPHVLDDRVMASSAVRRAEEAIGAPPGAIDDALRERIVTTLTGPLRKLRDEGRRFTIEVPTVLSLDTAVVEGTADLVADNATTVVVIELKLSAAAARGDAAVTQVQACCAGLEQQGETRTLRYACWGIGDDEPPAAQLWGKPARRQLAMIIAQLGVAPST